MSLAFLLGMFLCGLFRAGQPPQRLQGTREGKGEHTGMLYGHGRVPVVWSAGSGEQSILGEGKVFPVAPSWL